MQIAEYWQQVFVTMWTYCISMVAAISNLIELQKCLNFVTDSDLNQPSADMKSEIELIIM